MPQIEQTGKEESLLTNHCLSFVLCFLIPLHTQLSGHLRLPGPGPSDSSRNRTKPSEHESTFTFLHSSCSMNLNVPLCLCVLQWLSFRHDIWGLTSDPLPFLKWNVWSSFKLLSPSHKTLTVSINTRAPVCLLCLLFFWAAHTLLCQVFGASCVFLF